MIKVINTEKFIKENNLKGPVTSPQIFIGRSYAYNPLGIMSEEIFGIDGSPERSKSLSWVDLNCRVIHPALYDILNKRIERKIDKIISGEMIYSISDEGVLIENPDGEIDGFLSLLNNIDKIKFKAGEDEGDRNKLISMVTNNIEKGLFTISKLLIIPPRYREIMIPEKVGEKPDIGDMNIIYRKIIEQSNQIKGVSGPLYDILCYKMQMLLKELYEFVRIKVSKKSGMIRKLMLGKRVDFSARTVITPNPDLKIGTVGLPLRIACSIFEPLLIYGIVNSVQSKNIPDEFHDAVKEVLGKELDPELL